MPDQPVSPAVRAAWKLGATLRGARARLHRTGVETTPFELLSSCGYRLKALRVRPSGAGVLPALVVSPAIHQGIDQLTTRAAVVSADEIARLGYAVYLHDPAGRGESWGEEDYGGPEHQDDLRATITAAQSDPACNGALGVLSLSLGVAAAVGALSRWPGELPARWLVDWEGPCDREIITAGGTIMVPALGHGLDDDAYWNCREATRGVAGLRCGYVRLQAQPDHAQPEEVRHAQRMIRAAAKGNLPWFQLNDHPRGDVPSRPHWAPGGPLAANRLVLRKLAALRLALGSTLDR
ncbi:MAG: hypothetical protein FJ090_18885 [Deltaproteobacteria bacterium]|nr:hypothetical protein [Deltaproteobacteria bacterium]